MIPSLEQAYDNPLTEFKQNCFGNYFSQAEEVANILSKQIADERHGSTKSAVTSPVGGRPSIPGASSRNLRAVACLIGSQDMIVTKNPSFYPKPLDLHFSRKPSTQLGHTLVSDPAKYSEIPLSDTRFSQVLEYSAFLGTMTYCKYPFLVFVNEVIEHLQYNGCPVYKVKSISCLKIQKQKTATGLTHDLRDLTAELQAALELVGNADLDLQSSRVLQLQDQPHREVCK